MEYDLKSKEFELADAIELNDSYNRFTGRNRTVAQFEWQWINTPEGLGSMWLLLDGNNKIVGHHGLMAIRFSYFGRPILVGKTENCHIHPPYANKGLYFPFEKKFLKTAIKRFDMLYTNQGRGAPARVRAKLGYKKVSTYAYYLKVSSFSKFGQIVMNKIKSMTSNRLIIFVLSILSKIVIPILMFLFSRKGQIDNDIILEELENIDQVSDDLDKFWLTERVKFEITIDRTSKYLKWRIFDNPHRNYNMFIAKKSGKIVGYVITMMDKKGNCSIQDIIAKDNDEVVFNTILDKIVHLNKEKKIYLITFNTLLSNNTINRRLKRNGFRTFNLLRKLYIKKQEERTYFMVRVNSDDLSSSDVFNPDSWYYTDMIGEGAFY